MSYAKLLGLNEDIPDEEIAKLLKEKEFQIEKVSVKKKEIPVERILGDFGYNKY